MYDWLSESGVACGTVVTANRRLARILRAEYGIQQQNSGASAWRTPEILAWQDWLIELCRTADGQESQPTRINAHQSQWLWEICWREELSGNASSVAQLVKLSRDTWQRLADWRVSIGDVAAAAQGDDQHVFAAVAGRYLHLLDRDGLIDDAGIGALVLRLIEQGRVEFGSQYTFVGFDRQKPLATAIQNALRSAGATIRIIERPGGDESVTLQTFENSTAEFRAAGAWARAQIDNDPQSRIAVIATGLDSESDSITRRVREGATPGWQYGHSALRELVNTSFGQRLIEYPAISVATTLLRWLTEDISSTDVSLLLRSGILGLDDLAGRSRLEIRLRQLPDRRWTPSMLTAELRGMDETPGVVDWLARLAAFSKRRRELATSMSPAEWAIFIDETLSAFGWPGQMSLDSGEFQLVNRWRELLNEFAKLSLVSPRMTAGNAVSKLELLAGDTVFQSESKDARIQLLGTLEATGSEFDAVWISGLTSSNWPPTSSPSVLISRRLQQQHGMPDSTPDDTLRYAQRILAGIVHSARRVVCSYAVTHDDTEQSLSELLTPYVVTAGDATADPGWHAGGLQTAVETLLASEQVPEIIAGEKIVGGAAAIQRQMADPVSAFIQSRLASNALSSQATGIPAALRGSLIHHALHKIYVDLPSSETIAGWDEADLARRLDAAMDYAFVRFEKNADKVLHQLLQLERSRVSALLLRFVAIDGDRDAFEVASVEGEFEFVSGHIRLPLRFDRLDSYEDGSIAILDYKTGSRKQLLNRTNEVQQIQLFVYAYATDAEVAALALVNIDSREISFDGAGAGYTNTDEWPNLLQEVKHQIAMACEEMAGGDVRTNLQQNIAAARPLNLLTRFTELRRDSR